jgi:hypothetical protein
MMVTNITMDDASINASPPVAAYGIVALGYAHARLNHDFWTSEAGVTFENGESRPTYDWLMRPQPGQKWSATSSSSSKEYWPRFSRRKSPV